MRFYKGLLNALIISIVFYGSVYVFAQEVIDEKPVTSTIAKQQRVIDNITINFIAKKITIRTIILYLDSDGKIVKRERGKTITITNRTDNPETPENEATTDFDDFMKNASINKLSIVNAIKTHLIKGDIK